MLRVGIIGARGYAGEELINILLRHSQVSINYLTARLKGVVPISELLPGLKGRLDMDCRNFDLKVAIGSCDLFFLALPHTASMDIVPALVGSGKKVIDLSADYRLKNHRLYERHYNVKHKDKVNLKSSVYGLPELYSQEIKRARLVANPGCYPTAAILALAPLLASNEYKADKIIVDAKSGYSGAGKKPAEDSFWQGLKENFKAYKVDTHQHSAELEEELSMLAGKKTRVVFVPHLLPIERGILETIYVSQESPAKAGFRLAYAQREKVKSLPQKRDSSSLTLSGKKLIELYKKFYKGKPFVRIKEEGEFPQVKDVQNTNFCDIGIKTSKDKDFIIIISAIDNLLKGASGQAVQNMNLIYGFNETEGLL